MLARKTNGQIFTIKQRYGIDTEGVVSYPFNDEKLGLILPSKIPTSLGVCEYEVWIGKFEPIPHLQIGFQWPQGYAAPVLLTENIRSWKFL
jgi:hypothetical protein